MEFKVKGLRLQLSHWDNKPYLAIDFNNSVSMGIPISKKRFADIEKIAKKEAEK
jgi:hypothetical protein